MNVPMCSPWGEPQPCFYRMGHWIALPFRGSDALYEVIRRACRDNRSERFDSMGAFYRAWGQARSE